MAQLDRGDETRGDEPPKSRVNGVGVSCPLGLGLLFVALLQAEKVQCFYPRPGGRFGDLACIVDGEKMTQSPGLVVYMDPDLKDL